MNTFLASYLHIHTNTHALFPTTLSPPPSSHGSTMCTSNCFATRYNGVRQFNYGLAWLRQLARNWAFQLLTPELLPPALQALMSLSRLAFRQRVEQSWLCPALPFREEDSSQLYVCLEEGLRDSHRWRSSANYLRISTGRQLAGLAHQQRW